MTPPRETAIALCRTCGGKGCVTHNPAAPDPRGETSDTCPTCMGTGRPPAYSDGDHFDRLQDARAEHHGELPRDFYEEPA